MPSSAGSTLAEHLAHPSNQDHNVHREYTERDAALAEAQAEVEEQLRLKQASQLRLNVETDSSTDQRWEQRAFGLETVGELLQLVAFRLGLPGERWTTLQLECSGLVAPHERLLQTADGIEDVSACTHLYDYAVS